MAATSFRSMATTPRTPATRIGMRRRVVVLLALLLLTGVFAGPPVQASFDFRASFVANKVVRSWFLKQDGIQVWTILEKLNHTHLRQLWQKVDTHTYVQEVKEARHGQRQLMLYHGLRKTFLERLRYN